MLSATHYMHFEFIMHRISNSCGEVERAKAINSSDIQEVNHGRKSEAAFLLHTVYSEPVRLQVIYAVKCRVGPMLVKMSIWRTIQ